MISVCRYYAFICRKLSRIHKEKLLKLTDKFTEVAGCKVNMQKSVAFLYTNDEQSEKKITKTIPFVVAPRIRKHSGTEEANTCTMRVTKHRLK